MPRPPTHPNTPAPPAAVAQDRAPGSTDAGDAPTSDSSVAAESSAPPPPDTDTAAAYAAVAALTGETDEEVAAQVALAEGDPERVRVAAAAGIEPGELFAWRRYPDRLVVVTVAGEKITVQT